MMTVKIHGYDGMPDRLKAIIAKHNKPNQIEQEKETEPMAKLLSFEELMGTGQPTKADVDKAEAERLTKPAPAKTEAPKSDDKPIEWNDLVASAKAEANANAPSKIEWRELATGLDLAEVAPDGETDLPSEDYQLEVAITAPAGTELLVKVNGITFIPA